MTQFDPATLTPPPELWVELCERTLPLPAAESVHILATELARWGAQQAVDALRHSWPEPITDSPPTEVDADDRGNVQYRGRGTWQGADWEVVASHGWPWRHTPRYRPAPPPTLREQALEVLEAKTLRELTDDDRALIRQALTEQDKEVQG